MHFNIKYFTSENIVTTLANLPHTSQNEKKDKSHLNTTNLLHTYFFHTKKVKCHFFQYRALSSYCATLAHKTNHSFLPNAEFVTFDHPKYGLVPCLVSNHDIKADEEIFVHYGYQLDTCPDWYEEAWRTGNYAVPDSLKDEDDEMSIETENSHMSDHPKPSVVAAAAEKRPTFVRPELKAVTVAATDNNDDCSHQDEKHDTVGELSDIRMQTQVFVIQALFLDT